jgi:hypothetical protein
MPVCCDGRARHQDAYGPQIIFLPHRVNIIHKHSKKNYMYIKIHDFNIFIKI